MEKKEITKLEDDEDSSLYIEALNKNNNNNNFEVNNIQKEIINLVNENAKLKNIIRSKDILIEQFQNVVNISTNKIKELSNINLNLKKKVEEKENSENFMIQLNMIKNQLDEIEKDFSNQIKEKDNLINELSEKNNNLKKEKEKINLNYQEQYNKDSIEKQNLKEKIAYLEDQVFILSQCQNINN